MSSIEQIDLTGSGDNALYLDDERIRRLPQTGFDRPEGMLKVLVVVGDPGDRLYLDRAGYVQRPSIAGRSVWAGPSGLYGLEVSSEVTLLPPPP